MTISGKVVIPGRAQGQILLSAKPISFWGGIRANTGDIIDTRHDGYGRNVAGKIFAFPSEKGSSTGSAVLLESARLGLAPAAIVVTELPPVIALGSLIADELYGRAVPIVVISQEDFGRLQDNAQAELAETGLLSIC